MEAVQKLNEIQAVIAELEKLEKYLYGPIERFRKLRKEISSSADFLRGLQKSIRQADKKDHNLTLKIAAGMETADSEILNKFFERTINDLNEIRQEITEKWSALKEAREEKALVGEQGDSQIWFCLALCCHFTQKRAHNGICLFIFITPACFRKP